ncbi:MAG: SIS domain-containing protein [Chloroflexi bacterium]|nr:SIS domain-containing protein [Chloroflexota bacterium]
MKDHIVYALKQSETMLSNFIENEKSIEKIEKAASLFIECIKQGNTVFSCGNGGSMSDAMHFAAEFSGRYRKNRSGLSAIAISDPGYISCVANDFGYDYIFSRYLQANSRQGDCLLAISTSGKSENVLKAVEYAKDNEIKVISLTGALGTKIGSIADVDVCVGSSDFADRIQELHIKVIHILVELVERELFLENYGDLEVVNATTDNYLHAHGG